jgi:hypothetical protein
MVDKQLTSLERLSDDSSRVERMKPLPSVLKNQHVGSVIDSRNGLAEAEFRRTKTTKATWHRRGDGHCCEGVDARFQDIA